MSQVEQPDARLFPFHRPSLSAELPLAYGVSDDREAQRAAAGQARSHELSMGLARPCWPATPVALVGGWQLHLFWLGALVAAGCVVAAAVLYRRARRLRDAVRVADDELGIPVPTESALDLVRASAPMHLLASWYDEADTLRPEVSELLRRRRRRLREVDAEFVRLVHELRRAWVDDDLARWRRLPEAIAPVSERAERLNRELRARIAELG